MPQGKSSIALRHLTKVERLEAQETQVVIDRPFRSECKGGSRPCPLVGCRYNLYLNVLESGTIQFAHPGRDPEDVPEDESCSLDIADRVENGELTLDTLGKLFRLTRERIRQIESTALLKLKLPARKLGAER